MTRPQTLLYVPENSIQQSSGPSSPSMKLKLSRPRRLHESNQPTSSISSFRQVVRSSASSSPTAPWANGPYRLISKPRPAHETGASFCATEMSIIHNIIIRGLNSIVRQAPYVPDASRPNYDAATVQDLLFFTRAWCRNLDHHHHVEERTFFPLIEQMTGVVGLMDDLEIEHEEFHPGIVALRGYADRMFGNPSEYRWSTMRAMILGFAPALTNHLHSEIEFLLKMDQFDDEGLKRCWRESGKVAEKVEYRSDFFELFPFILGNADKTYDGGNSFPPVPKPLRYAMQHFFSKRHRGAWRFNCCDYFGQPMALQMIPESSEE